MLSFSLLGYFAPAGATRGLFRKAPWTRNLFNPPQLVPILAFSRKLALPNSLFLTLEKMNPANPQIPFWKTMLEIPLKPALLLVVPSKLLIMSCKEKVSALY